MRLQGFVGSFNAAVEGFIYVLKTERNMRAHFLVALFFLLLGIYLNFPAVEIMILAITITLVLMVEMINTAIELTIDMIKTDVHPAARIIKDVSAGAVLLTSINATIVGYILFAKKIPFNVGEYMLNIRSSPWHLTFMALILVFGSSILGKIIFHKGTPLRGGMPSGHSAIAFAIWTIIAFFSNNSIVIALAFLMAFLIARHRVKDAVHTVWEVIVGAILGILLTTVVFQIFH
ncbi:MAG: diacylglycerol kinase [Candidatus Omnitrophica bacterium]|nr:diacylglycerol kinase [Candidatus Omnitrophota bacterium]MBU0895935.1 diacylglycerol kinase [Candidatus Omnitrophota bacterium]MBU1037604.1 diacylglycerol kinase [Candidatus Omnitrophota bacterium]MBU1808099.1 diacylglycerol kinase [Candidatus Omnitrophota bacterium]